MNHAALASTHERRLINLKDAVERRGWIESLQCTEARLIEVMAVVGNSPEAVRLYLIQRDLGGAPNRLAARIGA
jgi:hypothetical protein